MQREIGFISFLVTVQGWISVQIKSILNKTKLKTKSKPNGNELKNME